VVPNGIAWFSIVLKRAGKHRVGPAAYGRFWLVVRDAACCHTALDGTVPCRMTLDGVVQAERLCADWRMIWCKAMIGAFVNVLPRRLR
jgi:hypothetical protein